VRSLSTVLSAGFVPAGARKRSTFPAGIEAPVQYGPSGSAFAVYMTQYQLLPYQRTAGMLHELAGLAISPGTLQRAVRVATARLEAPVTAIRDALVAAPVAHADETSRRVNGTLHWLPVLSHQPAYGLLPSSQTRDRGPGCVRPVVPIRGRTGA